MELASRVLFVVVTIGMLFLCVALVLPALFHLRPYVVLSASMEPKLLTGSLAYIDKSQTDIQTGDIITYRLQDDSTVTHRVLEVTAKDTFVTKGDANESIDIQTVTKDNVIGKYVFSIPYLGFMYHIIFTYKWYFLGYLAGILLCNKIESSIRKRRHE